uniref:YEATS domain-containing protein 2 n=1 Tax=Holothuria leucospilota TaxID=206669 RepID=A0A9Q1BVZ0_HOLLE|nr:YEATS domain-containing protein 2 [Holothuria leucospilota]
MEIKNKERELELADERIHQVRMMLDKLRACVVANFYGNAGNFPGPEKTKHKLDLHHPAIQRALGAGFGNVLDEGRESSSPTLQSQGEQNGLLSEVEKQRKGEDSMDSEISSESRTSTQVPQVTSSGQVSRFHVKKRIIVGNVSKYITADNREDSDPSTHKWMVYVRGPPEEPRIDRFVKKVWFFLHPSYRPNDLVEVKDPPFHLTRRGWGEFPIRVQLHFNDPRSKKVDIIHHLKLDRTYTGLQTLGAETIVDVELDRHLFEDEVATVSRPSTPTVTKVNYREGFKPGLSRTPPSLRSSPSVLSTKSSSPHTSDDQVSTPTSSPASELSKANSRRGTPVTLEESYGVPSRSSTPSPNLTNKVQIQSGMIVSSSVRSPDHGEGKFIQVMPTSVETGTTSTTSRSPKSMLELPKLSLTSGLVGNVNKSGDGKGGISWRIEEGKLMEVSSGKTVTSPKATSSKGLATPLQSTLSSSLVKSRAVLPSLKTITQSTPSPKSLTASSQMTVLGRQTVKSLLGSQKASAASSTAGSLQMVSSSPGAQYYITAKSTDPNLKGKVILIPHQVFAQASAQQSGGGKNTTLPKTTTKASGSKAKSSFLSPSNVLILPQGSIVPPLPPGSIVQIQQVPSPARASQSQAKVKSTTTLAKSGGVGAQTIVTQVKGSPALTSPTAGGKQTLTKVVQSAGVAKSQTGGVSLLPDIKSQLARTPSGGVILVQRMPPQHKPANTQVGPGIQKITVSQAQQGRSVATTIASQGQTQTKLLQGQTIILQSPTSSPPKTTGSRSLQVLSTPQVQSSKRVLTVTETAQTLPVSEGTVEITRTLTETVPQVKSSSQSITPLSEVIITKTRAPTTLGRIPGLSPIKPPTVSSASSTIHIKKEAIRDTKATDQVPLQVKKVIVQPDRSLSETGESSGQKAKGGVQLVTVKDQEVGEKVTIKTEPSDDYPDGTSRGEQASIVSSSEAVSVSSASEGVVLSAPSQTSPSNVTSTMVPDEKAGDSVKIAAPSLVKQEVTSSIKAATITSPVTPAVTRLADPTSRVIITQLTSPPTVNQTTEDKGRPPPPQSLPLVAITATNLQSPSSSAHVAEPSGHNEEQVTHVKEEPEPTRTEDNSNVALAGPSKSTSDTPKVPRTYLDQPALLKWCATLNMKLSGGVSLYKVKTMEELIRNIVKIKPLFKENRKVEELPYAALTLQEFQSWPIGKRRASEWLRALDVRKTAQNLIHKIMDLWEEKPWNTKKVMRWCRRHGYTPAENDLFSSPSISCEVCGTSLNGNTAEGHDCQTKWLTDIGILRNPTYSLPDDWCKNLQDSQKLREKDAEDDIIIVDVITASPDAGRKDVRKRQIKEEDSDTEMKVIIPESLGAQFVSDEANKVGIHFKSSEVDEMVFAPVVEEMIFSATKSFMSDLLRLSHTIAFDGHPKSRIPTEIQPAHVYQGIRSSPQMDFLTNDKMGVLNEVPSSQQT